MWWWGSSAGTLLCSSPALRTVPRPTLSLLPQSAVFRTWPFLGETADNFYNEKYLLIIFYNCVIQLIPYWVKNCLPVLFRCQWRTKAFKRLPFPSDILLTKQLIWWSCCCVCLFKTTKALSASKFDTSSSMWAEAVNWICLFWQTELAEHVSMGT